MSINIHAGRIVQAKLDRAYDMLISAKPEAEAVGRGMEVSWMAKRAVAIIDKAALEGAAATHPLHTAWCELLDRLAEVRRTRRRDPEIDFEFELWLFPLGRRTLVNVHTEQPGFRTWLDAQPFVDGYAYWDSTDPDETVDARAWRRRERDWRAVWPVGEAASRRCVTMVMHNHQTPLPAKADDALPLVPSIGDRLARIAWSRHVDEVYRARIDARTAVDPDWKPSGFGDFLDAEGAARDDHSRREEITAQIAPMVREITVDDLVGAAG